MCLQRMHRKSVELSRRLWRLSRVFAKKQKRKRDYQEKKSILQVVIKREIYQKEYVDQKQERKKMTGLSIDVIKSQIHLSEMYAGSEAVSTRALKELLEYKETGLTPQKMKEMDKLYLEKCQEVNELLKGISEEKVHD